ncbi:MAG TPA: hypothetical protein VGI88_08150 [Verrucomicrobiae bacterium]
MLFVLASLAVTAMAQPANDNFANRILMTGESLTVSGSLSNATPEAGEPSLPGISSGQTAWWSWTAPSNGIVSLSINGTGFEPLLTIYTGSDLSQLSLVASNIYQTCYEDGECGCHWRERGGVTFHVARGQAYQISVDSAIITDASIQLISTPWPGGVTMMGWGPVFTTNMIAGGSLQLGLQFTPAPINDDSQNAIRLTGMRTRIAASNAGATKQPGEPDHLGNPGGSSVWYTWTAPASGRATLSTNNIPPYLPSSSSGGGVSGVTITTITPTCGAEIDENPPPPYFPLLAAYTGTAVDALSPADCQPMGLNAYPNAVEFDAVKGQTYEIAYDGNMGTTGDITLYLALTKPASNDNFKNRIPLHGINVAETGFNAGATSEPGEPVIPGSVGKSVWWSWTAPVNGTASIALDGSDYPFPVSVFTGTAITNLSGAATNSGSVSFEAIQGKTYQIAVDDSAGLTGEIKFTLQVPPAELPLLSTRSSAGFTVLVYHASPRQVVLLQYSVDGVNWKNIGTATAHQNIVSFVVRSNARDNSYRAFVID